MYPKKVSILVHIRQHIACGKTDTDNIAVIGQYYIHYKTLHDFVEYLTLTASSVISV